MPRPLKPASDDPVMHLWWRHVPSERRPGLRRTLLRRRLVALINRRRSRITALVLLYLLICSIPLLLSGGAVSLSLLAILPMLLLPAVAALSWWLTWKEFHH